MQGLGTMVCMTARGCSKIPGSQGKPLYLSQSNCNCKFYYICRYLYL